MMRSYVTFLAVFAVIIALAALLYGSYVLLRDVDIKIPGLLQPSSGKRLLISMDGFRLAQTENGRVTWRMSASLTELFENKEALMKDIEIVFSNPDGKNVALIGENGVMDTTTGNATIRSGVREVRVVTSDGYLMTTNSLFWKAGDRLVRTPDAFKVLGKEIYLEGKGFSAAVDMRKVVVNSNVKAVLQE